MYITVENLSFHYGRHRVLEGISFGVKQGQCVGVVGKNGCGKSTLLSILSGIQSPATGSIRYGQCDMQKNRKQYAKYVGYVPQENALLEELTVLDNLRLWYLEKEKLEEELENGVLAELGLNSFKNKRVKVLSGGMKKRLSIGCALAANPPILILDEPGAALDLECKQDIAAYLKAYKEKGGVVLITTHEEQELDLCDRLLVISGGTIKEVNPCLRGNDLVSQF